MANIALIPLIIPQSEKVELKPLHMCPGYSNHTHSNKINISYIMTRGSEKDYIIAAEN
jgi:hypothetical protein